jgi:hypothetical protein
MSGDILPLPLYAFVDWTPGQRQVFLSYETNLFSTNRVNVAVFWHDAV